MAAQRGKSRKAAAGVAKKAKAAPGKATKSAAKKSAKPAPRKATMSAAKKSAKPAPRKATMSAAKKSAKPAPRKATTSVGKKTAKPVPKKAAKSPGLKVKKPLAQGSSAGKAPAKAKTAKRSSATPNARLSSAVIRQFRDILLLKRAELTGDLTGMRQEALIRNSNDSSGYLSNLPDHMADLGSDAYEQEFTLGLIENEQAVVREIDEALQRIEAGTYGICEETGVPIGRGRLDAKPWAKYCIEYARMMEKGLVRPGQAQE